MLAERVEEIGVTRGFDEIYARPYNERDCLALAASHACESF